MRTAGPLVTALLLAGSGLALAQTGALEGRWALTVGEDPSSYAVVASLQQGSAKPIKDEYATRDVVPQLILRCTPGDTTITARIDWQRFISSFKTEVGFKVDDSKTLWLKWGVDRSNEITISPSADDSSKLIEYLNEGTSLQVEVSPYSGRPLTVEFDLAGLSQGLTALRMECQ